MRPQFSRTKLRTFDIEEQHIQALLEVLQPHADLPCQWTNEVDLQPLFLNYTMDTATEFYSVRVSTGRS